MATRSTIAKVNEDGSVNKIYCHWDGYPEWNGKLLLEHYIDNETIDQLIELGDISSLDKYVDGETDENQTVSYLRDRYDIQAIHEKFESLNEYFKNCDYQEFNYLFVDGIWKVCEGEIVPDCFEILTNDMCGIK